ncbi:MAG TPA: sigma-54 dependent transcriptional regulator [Nitrospiria bacterium]|nr:sigma-54 dependent transcriptional regulator [Nitrospiria bacterium]
MIRATGPKTILIVEDEAAMRAALTESVRQMGYSVMAAANGEEALLQCETLKTDDRLQAVLTDFKMPGMNGLDFLQELTRRNCRVPVILISGAGSIETAVEAMKRGACDYLVKPFSQEAVEAAIGRALDRPEGSSPTDSERRPGGSSGQRVLITRDPELLKMLKTAEAVAASHATVLIEAESGTGKELLARFIHDHSPRAHCPFIAVNCAALPDSLLESELFGFEKGAFTGATHRKPGRFEMAHTGTILLDEISEMPLGLQAKLLRTLQEREVDVLGSKEPMAVDVRIIATTNRSLWEEVKAGRFREDLYYRLNVFPLRIAPLRNRIADIPLLVDHFIKAASARNQKWIVSITPEALARLSMKEWRGNVRELENVIERAVLLAQNGIIEPDHVSAGTEPATPAGQLPSNPTTIWEAEQKLIFETLEQTSGNRTHAARILGISIRTLRNKLRQYRETQPEKTREEIS